MDGDESLAVGQVSELETVNSEFVERAAGFVCYERLPYYLLTHSSGVANYPVLYLDRGLGFDYGSHDEPLLANPNGIVNFLEAQVIESVAVTTADLRETLIAYFQTGSPVACGMWFTHADGSRYATATLLEGITEAGEVLYTKISDSIVDVRRPLAWPDFLERLDLCENGNVTLRAYSRLKKLTAMRGMSVLDSYVYAYSNLFGYSKNGFEIGREKYWTNSISAAFDCLEQDYERSRAEILDKNGMSKYRQVRLFKHIHNRFAPAQLMVGTILSDDEARELLGQNRVFSLAKTRNNMDDALRDLQKWASFVAGKPTPGLLDRYLRSLSETRIAAEKYSKMISKLMSCIILERRVVGG